MRERYTSLLVTLLVIGTSVTGLWAQTALKTAVAAAVEDIGRKVPAGATVALPSFRGPSEGDVKLSDYVLGELTALLVNGGRFKVVERRERDIRLVRESLLFDASGDVSDESAQGIGHFLGAEYLITGSLIDAGSAYRLRVETVKVSSAEKVQAYAADIAKSDSQTALLLARSAPPAWTQPAGRGGTYTTSDTGVYVGIVSFGQNAEEITGGAPVFLDEAGLKRLTGLLDTRYQRSARQGTALYYGVHRALASLSANAPYYPENLYSVNVFTFTDGLDNGSTSLSLGMLEGEDFRGEPTELYRGYVKRRIANYPVAGIPVTAYSAGVRGSDVSDVAAFRRSLQDIASADGNFYELTDFAQLNSRFGNIAGSLTLTSENMTFSMVTPGYARGTVIRMTFDGKDGGSSGKYLEGTVALTADRRGYVLKDVKYAGGISSTSGSEVYGILNDAGVEYRFVDFHGYNEGTGTVSQWYRSGNTWQKNSEYQAAGAVKTMGEYRSAVVYIVLDSSASLSDSDIRAIREGAKRFITTLYERTTGKTAPAPAPAVAAPAVRTAPAGMALVPAGMFVMGSNDGEEREKPVHRVTISKPFYMSVYEITQKEWRDVMGTTIAQLWALAGNKGVPTKGMGDDYPMYYVSWQEAIEYCNQRSVKEGLTPAYSGSGDAIQCNFNASGYRLPTEAEWEWAARGGGKDTLEYTYSGSNSADEVAWYDSNSGSSTHIVGMKKANSLGLYDMSGNVWEWCWDWYGSYGNSAVTDPMGAASGSYRVLRGGSWYSSARGVRSAYRGSNTPTFRNYDLGFRVVRP
jgi:formylglycine-generating enzyme required for sulfatase activity